MTRPGRCRRASGSGRRSSHRASGAWEQGGPGGLRRRRRGSRQRGGHRTDPARPRGRHSSSGRGVRRSGRRAGARSSRSVRLAEPTASRVTWMVPTYPAARGSRPKVGPGSKRQPHRGYDAAFFSLGEAVTFSPGREPRADSSGDDLPLDAGQCDRTDDCALRDKEDDHGRRGRDRRARHEQTVLAEVVAAELKQGDR